MAQQTINNLETGLVVRGKINDNFTENYSDIATNLNNIYTNTSNIDTNVSDISTNVNDIAIQQERQYLEIRRDNVISAISKYSFPATFSLRYDDLPIVFNNGTNQFTTNFNVSDYKHTGGTDYYVNITSGSSGNDGLSRETPFQSIEKALTIASNGDNLIITDDEGTLIPRSGWANDGIFYVNVNVTSENKVIVFKGDIPSWGVNATYSNVYEITRSNVENVVDFNNLDVPIEYENVASVIDCSNTPYSYYTDNVDLYINPNTKTPSKILPLLNSGRCMVQNYNSSGDSTQDFKCYFEGLILVGGDQVVNLRGDTNYFDHEIYLKNCNLYYSTNLDNLLIHNSKRCYSQNCISAYSVKDGFNYSTPLGGLFICDFIEVNCIAYSNGDNTKNFPNTHNGSTAHTKSYGIRINGKYYNNVGGNVIDVQGVRSVGLGCIAFDSMSTDDGFNQGIGTQGAQGIEACEVWLEGCKSFGNISDLYIPTGDTLNVVKCEYDTVNGAGIKNFDDRL